MREKSIYRTWKQANRIRSRSLRVIKRLGKRIPPLQIYKVTPGQWALTSRPHKLPQPYRRQRFDWLNW